MSESDKDKRIEELEQVADALRDALWAILYDDQDNHISDDLHKQAVAAIDGAKEKKR